jgi:hypothetical protein
VDPPVTKWAKSGSVSVAYQVLGEGPFDLVYVPGFCSHVELAWDWPPLARFYRALASFSRLITFDRSPRSRLGWTMSARSWTLSARRRQP